MPRPSSETKEMLVPSWARSKPVRSDRHPRREQEYDLRQAHARQQAEHDRRERRDADDEGQGPEGLGLIHASARSPSPRTDSTARG